MKRLLVIGLSTVALAGCATPQYPVTRNYTPPPPIKPKYPINPTPSAATPAARPAPDAAVNSAAAASESQASGVAAAPTLAPVQSAPLAPPAPAPQNSSPPAASPPPALPPAPAPSPSPAPTYAYVPPHRERRAVTRTETTGHVVRPRGMYRLYVVREGDHLDSIARDLGVERAELVRANRLRKPYLLQPGQHIKAPVARAYEAVRGDTLAGVARRFGVSQSELAAINDLSERSRLSPGMEIALPPDYHDHGPTRVTTTEDVWVASRPIETYGSPKPSPSYSGGGYQASPEAVAAGEARRAEMAREGGASAYTTPKAYPAPTYAPPPGPTRPSAETLAALGKGRFIWPARGTIISNFGTTGDGRRNDGIDIAAPAGTLVRATAAGQVVYSGDQVPGFGNLVLIKHEDGWVSAYAHLADITVHMRDDVYQGQALGAVGETGGMSQPEVHFELRYAATPEDKAKPVDPVTLLPK